MFIPLGDDNSQRHSTPVVVYALVAINALVWFLQLTQGDPFTMGYSTVPLEITSGEDLVGLRRIVVGNEAETIRHYPGPTPIYLTLITSMFMHGSWMHIIGNMVYLFIFGDQIEDRLGRVKFVIFYLLCGLAAGLAQVVYQPDSAIPCLGASGAIAGVLGAYLVTHPRNQVRVLFFRMIVHLPAIVVLGGWFLLQVFSQISVVGKSGGGVAYMAHIGGFVAGVAMIFIFGRRNPAPGLAAGAWRAHIGVSARGGPAMIDDLWYKNAVFYCLDVGTFMDANGDGIGDFEGLVRRLDYLAGLGVTALWLQPFQPSPNRDDGYDTADYYGVDRRHGSAGDFVEFTQQARQRGMRVIIDLVINHTSDQHPWFKAARKDENSQYRGYYYWSKSKPAGANKGMVFPGIQTATWTYDKEAKAYYHHRFMPFQPDLNLENPAVREEVRKIMGYWLELGVSGFRVDAVPFIIESMPGYRGAQAAARVTGKGNKGTKGNKAGKGKTKGRSKAPGPGRGQAGINVTGSREKPRMDFGYLRDLHDFLQWRSGDAILLAEANIVPEENDDYFGPEGDRMHMILNFQANQNMFYALASGDCRPLAKALVKTKKKALFSQWGIFLRSHDELDLGRLEEDQRQQVFAAFGADKSMQLYDRGIRRRFAAMVGGDQRRMELAASLIFSLPGTPVMRYGDEIGMGDDLTLPDRQPVRTPMQWTGDESGGYSRAPRTEIPVICEGPFGCGRVNVADQKRDLHSLLNVYERMIRARKECPEIGWGDFQVLPTRSPQVLAVRCEWRNNAVLSVHNFSSEAKQVTLQVPGSEKLPLTNLLVQDDRPPSDDGRHVIDLNPYGYKWYRVGPLLDVMTREPQ